MNNLFHKIQYYIIVILPLFFSESNDHETKVTTSFKTTIPSLHKYTNYSISVLAFTSSGDGVKSPPIYCRTEEDGKYA